MIYNARKPRPLARGMGEAVAKRTIFRKQGNGNWETWGNVAERVSAGNTHLTKDGPADLGKMRDHIANGSILMSGRHLQHGDETQMTRNLEVYTNCSTASTSFLLYYLLLNGSGVGRCYDDDMCVVDWSKMPYVFPAISSKHQDYDYRTMESIQSARHKFGEASKAVGAGVYYFEVPDSREGWAKAVEYVEAMAYSGKHSKDVVVIDFSLVRPKGAPIKGMQGRPSAGPAPMMHALKAVASLKAANMPKWRQALYVDHYLAECVLVGGARRSARMSTKYWRDPGIFEFISVKQGDEVGPDGKTEMYLWSSNNSVGVDADFWKEAGKRGKWANKVFNAVCKASYATGEPGFINLDRLVSNDDGVEDLEDGKFVGSKRFKVDHGVDLLKRLARVASAKKHTHITNPCVTSDTWTMTAVGPRQVLDLIGVPFEAEVNGKIYPSSGFWKTGHKPVFRIETDRGYSFKGTGNHEVLVQRKRSRKLGGGYNTKTEWVKVEDLKIGDKVVLHNHRSDMDGWFGEGGSFDDGWLLGEIVGDGGFNPSKYSSHVRFWGENRYEMADEAARCVRAIGVSGQFKGPTDNGAVSQVMTVTLDDLCSDYIEPLTKEFKPAFEKANCQFIRGAISGFFDADGTVETSKTKGRFVRLSQVSLEKLTVVQRCLARFGIISTIYKNRKPAGVTMLPDGKGGRGEYPTQAYHELHVSSDNLPLFSDMFGFKDGMKAAALAEAVSSYKRKPNEEPFIAKVKAIVPCGEEDVYDCSVADVNCFDANGIVVHNCGEISLHILAGYCSIGDVVPYFCDSIDEAEEAVRLAARALVRVNTMDCLYRKEVNRTNRIGVSLTGVHEWAWKAYGFAFAELIDEEKSKKFWMDLGRLARAVKEEARTYSQKLGVAIPHTDTTVKPAGTTSKLFGLTEGVHLPSMREYIRWVQFREDDPLVDRYKTLGYAWKSLNSYRGTVIVGFPTQPEICTLGMGDRLVTAGEATPEEQYRWLMLLEKYWIRGVDETGKPLEVDTGNQISYSLKYNTKKVSYEEFKTMLLKYQSKIKCCTVMPQMKTDEGAYEYQPEQPVNIGEYNDYIKTIKDEIEEDLDKVHLDCSTGSCPIDFNKVVAVEKVEAVAV